jgi:hypothetical protein
MNMNCASIKATSAQLDIFGIHVDIHMKPQTSTSSVNNEYVTTPLAEVPPADQSSSEEELYISFEEAISERSSALHNQLNRYSHLAVSTQDVYSSDAVRHPQTTENNIAAHEPCSSPSNWQRFVVLVSLLLNFLLAGFDLMGWLVLQRH